MENKRDKVFDVLVCISLFFWTIQLLPDLTLKNEYLQIMFWGMRLFAGAGVSSIYWKIVNL